MSVGLPVVVSSTKVDRFYFNDEVVSFFESGNVDQLANVILGVLQDKDLQRRMTEKAFAYASARCWNTRKADYLNLLDCLCLK